MISTRRGEHMDKKLYKHGKCSCSDQDEAKRAGMPCTTQTGLPPHSCQRHTAGKTVELKQAKQLNVATSYKEIKLFKRIKNV